MRKFDSVVIAIIFATVALRARAGDWPQFRCDASRSAASAEQLESKLHLQWVRDMGTPAPAFPRNVRLEFDVTYEPVVMGDLMFVPSMITESVTALDTSSGEQRWRFFADGPVRFAPLAWQDKVYFVADDGFLYCLNATDGTLRWKFRGLPSDRDDRMLLGSGRLISLSPARGGPVLHNSTVYFAAGLWPAEGVFVHALDAESGEVVWSNLDSHHIPGANQDHGIAQYAGIAPQGYLAVVDDKLVVPCGAQLPALLDLETGKLSSYHMGWGGRDGLPKGTWFVAGSGRYLCQSGDIYDLRRPNDEKFREPRGRPDFKNELYTGALTRIRIDPSNHKDIGSFRQPVFAPDAFFENDGGITARDLTSVELLPRDETAIPANRRDDTYPDRFTAKFEQLWKLPSKLDVHIKAGDKLYCAGPGKLAAVQIPQSGNEPKVVWQSPLDGTPIRLLAANGQLFVVLREGRIMAFGAAKPESVARYERTSGREQKTDEWAKKAAQILEATGKTDGYALVMGLDSGRLVEELAIQSDLLVIAIDPDPSKVDFLRHRFQDAGLYGSRIWLRVGKPLSYPLPPYLADLIVSEHASGDLRPNIVGAVVRSIFPKLRPYGGTACLSIGGTAAALMDRVDVQAKFSGLEVHRSDDWTLLRRTGALPGAADWSHELANATGSGASADSFVKAPLGLLWFDASQEWHRKPGSAMVRISGGRVLIKAQKLHAIDVFTGRSLWEAVLPFAHTAADQLVTASDALYLTNGKTCYVLDPINGKVSGRIELPDEAPGGWKNLRCWQEYLVCTSGRYVVCWNRHTKDLLWRFECNRPALSVCVGGGRVFCAEMFDPRRGEQESTAVKTRAIDVRTGDIKWEIARGSKLLFSEPFDLLVNADGIFNGANGQLVKSLPKPTKGAGRKSVPGPLFVIGDKLLWGTLESFTVINLVTGQRDGGPTSWVRRGCTTIRASEHLVTTRVRANAAYIDLESRQATSLWNVRPACLNNLYPADGVLNVPNVLGGCTCNYTHASQAYVPMVEILSASR